MCFSATASFVAGAALVPAGIYCTTAAFRKNLSHLPLAVVPLVFAVHQFTEGLVWIGLNRDGGSLVQGASVAYLFFAMAFWPFWIPLCFLCSEQRRGMKWLLGTLTVLSLAWTWLYVPILFEPNAWLTTQVVHHSIRYEIGEIPGYDVAARWAWRLGYLALVAVPVLVGVSREQPSPAGRAVSLAGALGLVASFVVSYYLYTAVFLSVWCFFAAVLAFMLCYVFYRLPAVHDEPLQVWKREIAVAERV